MEAPHLGPGISKTLTLHSVCLWESAFVADSCNTKLFLWWQSKALIYNISSIKSLVVILFLHSFSRPVVFCFMVASKTIYSQILDHLRSVLYGLSNVANFKSNHILVGYCHKLCGTIAQAYLILRTLSQIKGLVF